MMKYLDAGWEGRERLVGGDGLGQHPPQAGRVVNQLGTNTVQPTLNLNVKMRTS